MRLARTISVDVACDGAIRAHTWGQTVRGAALVAIGELGGAPRLLAGTVDILADAALGCSLTVRGLGAVVGRVDAAWRDHPRFATELDTEMQRNARLCNGG